MSTITVGGLVVGMIGKLLVQNLPRDVPHVCPGQRQAATETPAACVPKSLAIDAGFGELAEWLRSGLQIRVHRFDSGTRLHLKTIT